MSERRGWWAEPQKLKSAVSDYLARIMTDEPVRYRAHERILRMWGRSAADVSSPIAQPDYQPAKAMVGWNVVRNVVEALHADLLVNRPRVMVVPRASDAETRWSLIRAARKAESWLDGWWDQAEVTGVMSEVALDGLLFDGAAVLVRGERLCRVPPWHLHLDPSEGGDPHTWCVTYWLPAHDVEKEYGYKSDYYSPPSGWGHWVRGPVSGAGETALVTELWRDGEKHVVLVGSEIVEEEEWTEQGPVVTWRWQHPLVGWWSDSPAYQLAGLQYEINQERLAIARAHRTLGKAKLLWPESCGTPSSQWDNEVATVIKVKSLAGGMPQVLAQQSVPPDIYAWVERLRASAYELVGASQITASAAIPAQLSGSGKSIEVYEDATSRRHLPQQRAWERAHVELARRALSVAASPKQVRSLGGVLTEVSPSQFRAVLDNFDCATYPVAFLSRSPSGRLRDLERWLAYGWVTREEAMRLADFPSTTSYAELQTAMLDAVTADAEALLDGERRLPDEYYDYELILRIMPRVYRRAVLDGAPDEVLENIDMYIQAARARLPEPLSPPAAT